MESTLINNIIERLQGRSIFLIGMMACGKSKTGPKLAEILKYKFIDLDLLIEKVSRKTISNIFNEEGEEVFRELETKCLSEVIKFPRLVVSTGGGVITKNQNWGILRQGIVIWIDLRKEIALKRLRREVDKRPLLFGKDLDETYTKILDSRKDFYEQADIRIQISDETVFEVAERIIYKIDQEIIN